MTGPKKGGNILLKDAFGSAYPTLAASSAPYDAHYEAGPSATTRSNGFGATYAAPSTSLSGGNDPIASLPPLPQPLPPSREIYPEERDTNGSELLKVPRLRSKPSDDAYTDNTLTGAAYGYQDHSDSAGKNKEEEDLSEGECEAQMRKLRRSLSIERRFEKAAEEERPRLLRHAAAAADADGRTDPGAGRDERNNLSLQELEWEKEKMRELNKGWSFTSAVDAWEK